MSQIRNMITNFKLRTFKIILNFVVKTNKIVCVAVCGCSITCLPDRGVHHKGDRLRLGFIT